MKKAQMETSMIRFIGELRKVANDLDNLNVQEGSPTKTTFKDVNLQAKRAVIEEMYKLRL